MTAEPPAPASGRVAPGMWQRLTSMVQTDARRLVATGVPHLFVALALTQGLNVIRSVLLTRMLTVPELGTMSLVMRAADWLVVLADLGICTAVLKYAAEPGSDDRRRQIYTLGLLAGSVVGAVVGLVYLAVALALPAQHDTALRTFMLMVAPYIPLAALVRTPLGFMQARKQIQRAARFTAITQVIGLVFVVSATYLFRLTGFFATVSLAPLVNLVLLLAATRHELRMPERAGQWLRRLGSFGFVSMLTNAAGTANAMAALMLLEYLTHSRTLVGFLSVALLVANGMQLPMLALINTAFPYLSSLLAEPRRLRSRMREMILKQTAVMLLMAIVWCLVGVHVIRIILGPDKVDAFEPSLILLPGLLARCSRGAPGQVLLALGRVRVNLAIEFVQLLVTVLGCRLLIPYAGLSGAALAVSISDVLCSLAWFGVVELVLARDLREN